VNQGKRENRGGPREGSGRPPSVAGYGPVRKVRLPSLLDQCVMHMAESVGVAVGDAIAILVAGPADGVRTPRENGADFHERCAPRKTVKR
jgi:hypothetical protein